MTQITNITHDFFDPLTVDTIKHLIVIDNLKRAQAAAVASTENYVKSLNAASKCEGCNDCKCCGTDDTSEYLSVKEYAEDFGITLSTGATMQLNDAAMKESARQKQMVGEADNFNVYHPEVLKIVFGPLLKMLDCV